MTYFWKIAKLQRVKSNLWFHFRLGLPLPRRPAAARRVLVVLLSLTVLAYFAEQIGKSAQICSVLPYPLSL